MTYIYNVGIWSWLIMIHVQIPYFPLILTCEYILKSCGSLFGYFGNFRQWELRTENIRERVGAIGSQSVSQYYRVRTTLNWSPIFKLRKKERPRCLRPTDPEICNFMQLQDQVIRSGHDGNWIIQTLIPN